MAFFAQSSTHGGGPQSSLSSSRREKPKLAAGVLVQQPMYLERENSGLGGVSNPNRTGFWRVQLEHFSANHGGVGGALDAERLILLISELLKSFQVTYVTLPRITRQQQEASRTSGVPTPEAIAPARAYQDLLQSVFDADQARAREARSTIAPSGFEFAPQFDFDSLFGGPESLIPESLSILSSSSSSSSASFLSSSSASNTACERVTSANFPTELHRGRGRPARAGQARETVRKLEERYLREQEMIDVLEAHGWVQERQSTGNGDGRCQVFLRRPGDYRHPRPGCDSTSCEQYWSTKVAYVSPEDEAAAATTSSILEEEEEEEEAPEDIFGTVSSSSSSSVAITGIGPRGVFAARQRSDLIAQPNETVLPRDWRQGRDVARSKQASLAVFLGHLRCVCPLFKPLRGSTDIVLSPPPGTNEKWLIGSMATIAGREASGAASAGSVTNPPPRQTAAQRRELQGAKRGVPLPQALPPARQTQPPKRQRTTTTTQQRPSRAILAGEVAQTTLPQQLLISPPVFQRATSAIEAVAQAAAAAQAAASVLAPAESLERNYAREAAQQPEVTIAEIQRQRSQQAEQTLERNYAREAARAAAAAVLQAEAARVAEQKAAEQKVAPLAMQLEEEEEIPGSANPFLEGLVDIEFPSPQQQRQQTSSLGLSAEQEEEEEEPTLEFEPSSGGFDFTFEGLPGLGAQLPEDFLVSPSNWQPPYQRQSRSQSQSRSSLLSSSLSSSRSSSRGGRPL